MKITKIRTFGWEGAIEGMRYPKNSEAQSDSGYFINNCPDPKFNTPQYHNLGEFKVGPKDLDLILRLTKAGKDHRKVLRMIHVQASVDMPMTWWAQYDTYKVGTVANSRSRMHKFGSKYLSIEDFTISKETESFIQPIINTINELINKYTNESDPIIKKIYWKTALDLLPQSYNQERMIDLNYEVLISILGSRYRVEKLSTEWNYFGDCFLEACPYLNEIFEAVKKQRSMTTQEFENAK